MTTKATLTAETLRERLSYDPDTGLFHWRYIVANNQTPRIRAGVPAGSITETGYRRICVLGRLYYAGPLAWLYMTGQWPADELDHINRDRDDNRFTNLRPATRGLNNQNQSRPLQRSRSGYYGVVAKGRRYEAKINIGGRRIRLGMFDNAEEASAAYISAKRRLHPYWKG